MTTEDAAFDVVVVGSGGAGMTAALAAAHQGLSAVVLEKTGLFGGSTARSGGGIWAPGGLAQGRSVEPVPLDGRVLGTELGHLNPPYLPSPDGVTVTQADYRWL